VARTAGGPRGLLSGGGDSNAANNPRIEAPPRLDADNVAAAAVHCVVVARRQKQRLLGATQLLAQLGGQTVIHSGHVNGGDLLAVAAWVELGAFVRTGAGIGGTGAGAASAKASAPIRTT
jgi:hypothetical protein